MIPYTLIDHTADLGIAIEASSLKDLFKIAGDSFCDLICDIKTIKPLINKKITIKRDNLEELLQGFLSELLFLFDTKQILFSEIIIDKLDRNNFILEANVGGEIINKTRHKIKTGIKAITYHQLKIEKVQSKWKARIIFDV